MKSKFKIKAAGRSDIGKRRSSNQDNFLVNASLGLFAVADGMGGHSGGEVASELAIKTLETIFKQKQDSDLAPTKLLEECVHLCNRAIYDQGQEDEELQGMGTTLTAVAVEGPWLHIAQVGDSRCYLYRDGELFQVTEDHSQVYEMLKAGLINEASMHSFHKNVITRSVGYESDVNVDLFSRLCQKGDTYLICSDGLTGMVSNDQIAQVLNNFEPSDAVQNLVDLANIQGGEDNISVIVFQTR